MISGEQSRSPQKQVTFRAITRRDWFLWPAPAQVGLIGGPMKGEVVLLTNHAPTIRRWITRSTTPILSVDGGGLAPAAAAALGNIRREDVEQALRRLHPASERPPGQGPAVGTEARSVLVPGSLAAALGLVDGAMLEGWVVRMISTQAADRKAWLERLLIALRLAFGQWLLMLLPAMLFGWQSALLTGIITLVTAVLLSLVWKILPVNHLVKGLFVGSVIAGGIVLLGTLAGLSLAFLYPAGGCLIMSVWMANVLHGAAAW